jgi:hypothetical protein
MPEEQAPKQYEDSHGAGETSLKHDLAKYETHADFTADSAAKLPPLSSTFATLPPSFTSPSPWSANPFGNPVMPPMGIMAVNDTAFTPKPFAGTTRDVEKTEKWLDYFTNYTEFRSIHGQSRLQLFKLLLQDQAADWLRSLSDDIRADYTRLIAEFRKRFSLTDIDRWQKASAMWSRDQKPGELVDTYIADLQNTAKMVPITDHNLIRFAIVRGLRPEVRLHVLQSQAGTMEEVIKAARVAESALASSSGSPDITLLTKQVSELLTKLAEKPSVAAVDTRSPSRTTSPRRVSFSDNYHQSNSPRGPLDSPPINRSQARASPTTYDSFNNDSRASSNSFLPRWNSRDDGPRQNYNQPASSWRNNQPERPWSARTDSRARYSASPARQPQQSPTPTTARHYGNCRNCGGSHASDRLMCRAYNISCFSCGQTGHLARWCRSTREPQSRVYRTSH